MSGSGPSTTNSRHSVKITGSLDTISSGSYLYKQRAEWIEIWIFDKIVRLVDLQISLNLGILLVYLMNSGP